MVFSVAACAFPNSLRHLSLHHLYEQFLDPHPGTNFVKIGKFEAPIFQGFAMDSFELHIFTKSVEWSCSLFKMLSYE